MFIEVEKSTIKFEAAPVCAELAFRILLMRIAAARPTESAPESAIRNALRTDFATAIGNAMKNEETGSRTRQVLIEKLGASGLDSIGAQLEVPRLEGETDTDYRVRLFAANAVEEQPFHKVLIVHAEAMSAALLEAPEIVSLVESLSAAYGIE